MKYNGSNLEEVLAEHVKYIGARYSDPWGEEGSIASFHNTELRGVNFSGKDLRHADFTNAVIRDCDFTNARLCFANFDRADIGSTTFNNADMERTDFTFANASRCSFNNVKFYAAGLRASYFGLCDFDKAEFDDQTDLSSVLLDRPENMPYIPMVCPEEGEFIGWKKCFVSVNTYIAKHVIVKLKIPAHAQRSSGLGRKCRASEAWVLEIQELDGTVLDPDIVAFSRFDASFEYRVGNLVVPSSTFNPDRWLECASGIHFFLNRQEAVRY